MAKGGDLAFLASGQNRNLRYSPHELFRPLFQACAVRLLFGQNLEWGAGLMFLCSHVSMPRPVLADLDGGFENRSDGEYASQFMRRNGGQAHGRKTSARCAIRISTKL